MISCEICKEDYENYRCSILDCQYDLICGNCADYKKANIFVRFWRGLKNLFVNKIKWYFIKEREN